jgi:hypothetical protein
MSTESGKPLIVISYAHQDEPEHPAEGEVKWLSFVTGYLRPAIKQGAIDLWLDRLMRGGAAWEREIRQKLGACDIFILLVSRHSLSSEYVVDNEIPIIRKREANGEAVHFYPLVLTPTPDIALDLVRDKNLRPRDGKPFSDYSLNERYRHMTDTANEIAEIAAKIKKRKAADRGPLQALSLPESSSPSASTTPIVITGPALNFILAPAEASQEQQPHISDEASLLLWLTDQSPEVAIAIASRTELRISPLVVHAAQGQPGPDVEHMVSQLTGAVFRVGALARVAAKYPERASDFVKAADSAMSVAVAVAQTAGHSAAALGAIKAAIASATAISGEAKPSALSTVSAALDATVGVSALSVVWGEIRADVIATRSLRAGALVDLPLWSGSTPRWAEIAWGDVQALLPQEEDWNVWIEWYEDRLRGGSPGKDYELVFASVPQNEWDKGPAAANAWIRDHLPALSSRVTTTDQRRIKGRVSLESWLAGQSTQAAIVIAAREALRTAPLTVRRLRDRQNAESLREVAALTSAAYRAAAVPWAYVRVPVNAANIRLAARLAALGARRVRAAVYSKEHNTTPAARALTAAARAADSVARTSAAARAAARSADAASEAFTTANPHIAPQISLEAAWRQVQADVVSIEKRGADNLCRSPLWTGQIPEWATLAWSSLKAALEEGEDWDVWIDWYEERLRGGSRGEDYELVFASVPEEEWDKGPAAANAWIRAHLPKTAETAQPVELPTPVSNLEAPFAYGWTASQRIAVVAGEQNLPDYRHFSSEEDHRRVLEACRVGGERLVKSLRSGRYNARPEYGEAVEYYLDDLPKTAGAGNILLANSQARILHDMFLADADTLSPSLASALKSFIGNHFSLCAFYDLVQRHNEAVSAGNWSRPFPLDEAKSFFGAVKRNTPRWFEARVEQGLWQVEQAEPPAASTPEPPPASVIAPPPLPPGTPDAQDSWKRQMATAANAVWETFLQGRDMPVDKDEWRRAADELGPHVRPIIEFLRAQERPNGATPMP